MTLDKVANVVTIIAGLAVSGTLAIRAITPAPGPPDPRPNFSVGERLSGDVRIDYSRKPYTIVLAVDPACAICTGNMPFFKRMIEQSRDSATRVVVVGKDSVDRLTKYLGDHEIADVEVISTPLKVLKITAVPTMVLADRDGRFAEAWVGGLPPPTQEQLLTQMRNGWKRP
jgi:hypothetical protein